ncbi:14579_t:CDS:2, partial [Cetraspora pellucida]
FEMVLQQIKDFAIDVTQLQGYKKLFKANLVSEKFIQLTNDFNRVMKDLNFTLAISSDVQRINNQKNLKKELDKMKKFFFEFEERNSKQLNMLYEELLIIKKQMSNKANDSTSIINEIQTQPIAPNELKDPFSGQKDDIRDVIIKKVFGEYEKELSELKVKYVKAGYSYGLLPDKSIDLDRMNSVCAKTMMPDIEFKELEFDNNAFEMIMSLKEGIELHYKGDEKSYYLSKSYVIDENLKEAKKLFKEAADYGIADAQLNYAFTLIKDIKNLKKQKEFLKYLKLSADQRNEEAEYHLGKLYLKGSIVEADREIGLSYLWLAALNDHVKA